MKVVACIKQVPSVVDVKIDPQKNTLIREGVPSEINPFDEFAVEEAISIKEKYLFENVTAISMGPPQAEEALRACLGMGVDEAILLSDPLLAGSDTFATSYALSRVIEEIGFDIIICGQESTDSSTGQVGPGIAEHLGIPQVTFVSKIVRIFDNKIEVFREVDKGYMVIESKLPILLTVVKGINTPRSSTSVDINKRVKKIGLEDMKYDPKKVGIEGSPTRVIKITYSKNIRNTLVSIPNHLSAHERIKMIMSGGIQENKSNNILFGSTLENVHKVADLLFSENNNPNLENKI